MSTFAQIADRAGITCRANLSSVKKKGIGDTLNLIKLAREAENEFIEHSHCHSTFTQLDTSALNGGNLSDLYDIPAGFIEELRIRWDGFKLTPIHQQTDVRLRDSSDTLITGLPRNYWLEDEQIRLIPKPSSHGIIDFWYVLYNISTVGASPIIPTIEHRKLRDYVVGMVKEANGEEAKAKYYLDRFYAYAADAKTKYEFQRNKQSRIYNVVDGETYYPGGLESRVPLVSE